MPMRMDLWKIVNEKLKEAKTSKLDFEERLEKWIVEAPSILGMDILIIGRQVLTDFGGRIDLLGLDRQGGVVILELKRDRTPRDVVAQTLHYATWVKDLTYTELNLIASEFLGRGIASAFAEHFDESVPDTLNSGHGMVIVASELDEASERIVQYLASEYGVSINAIFFNLFEADGAEFLGRAWLMDPEEVQDRPMSRKQVPWSGYWFVNVGEGPHRNWDDNRRYGYIAAGQGVRYSRPLQRLGVGDRVFAYMKGLGYVGYGEVRKQAVMIRDFVVEKEGKPPLDLDLKAPRADENCENPELSEWVVGINWVKALPREGARRFKGIFANQNIVCRLRHQTTVDFLESEFGIK